MNKLILPVLLIIAGVQAKAQFTTIFKDTATNNSIELFTNYNVGSNAITNSFINKFYLQNYINDNLKNSVSKNLDPMNNVGGDLNYGITYTRFKNDSIGLWGMKNTGYYVSLKNRTLIDGRFSRDFFNVFFDGNQSYKGKTADFSDFNFNSLTYQQLEFGLIKKIETDQKQYVIGGGLSLLNGQSHTSIISNKSSLFTQQDGEYIDFTTNSTISRSDTSQNKLGKTNGLGLSTHFFISYSSPAGSTLKLEVSDLGFIRWNKESTTLKLDTSFHFEGIAVNNIFNFADPAYSNVPSDSAYIARFLNHVKQDSYNSFLPALIELSYDKKINKYTFLSGIKYRLNANYIPYLFMGCAYNFNPLFYVSANIGYGGYTKLSIGLELAKRFAYGFTLLTGSQFIYGYLSPAQGTAQGAYISLEKNF